MYRSRSASCFLLFVLLTITACAFYIITSIQNAPLITMPQYSLLTKTKLAWNSETNTSGLHRPLSTNTSNERPTRVLLLTYYRGGSSFLGQILAQSNQSFYWFEPLHDLVDTILARELLNKYGIQSDKTGFRILPNDSIRELPEEISRRKVKAVAQALTCKATQMSQVVLADHFTKRGSRPYNKCLQQTDGNIYETCAQILESICLNKTLVSVKVIRLAMHEARRLKEIIPDLKVIHYIRDPRATITSRAAIRNAIRRDIGGFSRLLCLQIAKNQEVFEEMRRQQPEDYLLLRYEDLALEPVATAKRIYDFIGYEMSAELLKWIEENTNASITDWKYGTRRNSTKTVYSWRQHLTGEALASVNNHCRTVLEQFGYEG